MGRLQAGSRVRQSGAAARLVHELDRAGDDVTLLVDDHRVAVTHLDRVYWPAMPGRRQAVTKRDHLRYLIEVAAVMLPLLRDRPLTLFRWPEGIAQRRVLEKHWPISLPAFVERVSVFSESKGHDAWAGWLEDKQDIAERLSVMAAS